MTVTYLGVVLSARWKGGARAWGACCESVSLARMLGVPPKKTCAVQGALADPRETATDTGRGARQNACPCYAKGLILMHVATAASLWELNALTLVWRRMPRRSCMSGHAVEETPLRQSETPRRRQKRGGGPSWFRRLGASRRLPARAMI